MAITWGLVKDIGKIAFQALMSYLAARRDDAEREADREMILTAIKQTREQILDRLNLLEANQLRGELEGFEQIYGSYDPDPNDPVEEGRLVSLIDDSARVLGRLGAHVDTVGANPDLAFEAWTIYLPLLYLRAQAMIERQRTYGVQETADALSSFDMAIQRAAGLLAYLRQVSDSRFGPVVCKPVPDSQDARVCWYWWGNEQFICGSTRDPAGVLKCQQSRARNMDLAYQAFDGVAEITAAAEELRDAREAIDTMGALHALIRAGVNVGEIVVSRGRLLRSRPMPGRADMTGDAARAADWLS
jgi:hypothetical protein